MILLFPKSFRDVKVTKPETNYDTKKFFYFLEYLASFLTSKMMCADPLFYKYLKPRLIPQSKIRLSQGQTRSPPAPRNFSVHLCARATSLIVTSTLLFQHVCCGKQPGGHGENPNRSARTADWCHIIEVGWILLSVVFIKTEVPLFLCKSLS